MSTTTAPKMRRALPRPVTAPEGAAAVLAALEDWAVEPLAPEATGVDAPAGLRRASRPWDGIDPSRLQQLNVDIPTVLHARLRWAVQSTYGLTLKRFVSDALDAAVTKALEGQGDA